MFDIPLQFLNIKASKFSEEEKMPKALQDLILGSEKFYLSIDDTEIDEMKSNLLSNEFKPMSKLPYPIMTLNISYTVSKVENKEIHPCTHAHLLIEKSALIKSGLTGEILSCVMHEYSQPESFTNSEDGYYIFRYSYYGEGIFLSPIIKFISYEKSTQSDFDHIAVNFIRSKMMVDAAAIHHAVLKSITIDYIAAMVVNLMTEQATTIEAIHPNPKTNRLRSLRKKPPLFSYKMLTIDLHKAINKISSAKGFNGSHASPRAHTRRGHYRNYKNGKKTWIESMLVNPESKNGKIEKTYSVK